MDVDYKHIYRHVKDEFFKVHSRFPTSRELGQIAELTGALLELDECESIVRHYGREFICGMVGDKPITRTRQQAKQIPKLKEKIETISQILEVTM
ncbi:hypothetical protein ABXV18_27175 [Vibrio owensii]|uniref:hypothetical protein n=1 Tax=Vibrio owensii TaxID=696485 RepID=UPI003393F87C